MNQYRFRALVAPSPAAREGPARERPGRARATRAHTRLLQPFHCCDYFPAVIAQDGALTRQPDGHAVVTIALDDGEADVFFAAGQRFTIWADGIVYHTVRAEGLLGYGVICGRASLLPLGRDHDGSRGKAAGPTRVRHLADSAATGMAGPGPAQATVERRRHVDINIVLR